MKRVFLRVGNFSRQRSPAQRHYRGRLREHRGKDSRQDLPGSRPDEGSRGGWDVSRHCLFLLILSKRFLLSVPNDSLLAIQTKIVGGCMRTLDHFPGVATHCPNYLFGLGNTGHACALSGSHCKLFEGLRCEPFARMNPSLFPAASESIGTSPPLETCRECGDPFIPGSNRSAWCAACSKLRRKEKLSAYSRSYRKRRKSAKS